MNIKQNILQTIRILFIGNSLVIRNNLPNMLQMMILRRGLLPGQTVSVTSIARPAASFNTFSSDKNVRTLIKSPNAWTHVILQEQSDKLALGLPFEQNYVWPSALALASDINSNKPAKLLWYQTMAHSGGNRLNDTYDLMQDRIIEGYYNLDKITKQTYPDLNTTICTIGKVWKKMIEELNIMNKNPLKILYTDSIHPSISGTYLISLVFYKKITNRNARSLRFWYKPKRVSKWFIIKSQKIVDYYV